MRSWHDVTEWRHDVADWRKYDVTITIRSNVKTQFVLNVTSSSVVLSSGVDHDVTENDVIGRRYDVGVESRTVVTEDDVSGRSYDVSDPSYDVTVSVDENDQSQWLTLRQWICYENAEESGRTW